MIVVLIILAVIGISAIAAMAYTNRTDAGIESGITSFQRELDALAPRGDPRAGHTSRPRDGADDDAADDAGDDAVDEVSSPSVLGPSSGRVTVIPPGRGDADRPGDAAPPGESAAGDDSDGADDAENPSFRRPPPIRLPTSDRSSGERRRRRSEGDDESPRLPVTDERDRHEGADDESDADGP